mmetsp:Transcript_28020/g.32306  ORF Transcript_28020/g.32306 Transcript_28020/m.32306 type:complete len:99 (+) Transcript_28020:376-672(+)
MLQDSQLSAVFVFFGIHTNSEHICGKNFLNIILCTRSAFFSSDISTFQRTNNAIVCSSCHAGTYFDSTLYSLKNNQNLLSLRANTLPRAQLLIRVTNT